MAGREAYEAGWAETTEHMSQRVHDREARGHEGGYCETVRRAPRKRRDGEEAEAHDFRHTHTHHKRTHLSLLRREFMRVRPES